MEHTELFQRPIDENGFAVDVFPGDGPPGSGIIRSAAMIAHHVVFACFYAEARSTDAIQEFLGNIRFFDPGSIEKHCAFYHFYPVARDADDAFYVGLGGVARVEKDNHVAAVDLRDAEAVGKLVDEDPFLIDQGGHHGCALDLDRLIEEEDDRDRDEYTQHQIAQEESCRSDRG